MTLDLKELESRMDNWDEAKKIFAVFAELKLLSSFSRTGINAAELLMNLTKADINRLTGTITGKDGEYTTFEAFGVFNSFLLFFSAKQAVFPGLLELATAITEKMSPK